MPKLVTEKPTPKRRRVPAAAKKSTAKKTSKSSTTGKSKATKSPSKSDKRSAKSPRSAGKLVAQSQAEPNASLPTTMEERRILSIDIGGTKWKMLMNGELEPRKGLSGRSMTPMKLVEFVNEMTADWDYDAVSIGIPCLVGANGPLSEPGNLGPGWVGFDFASAFGKPVKILNDAAMQAVGSYEGGRMLFLGFGTGLGSSLIVDNAIVPLELGNLRWSNGVSAGQIVGKRGKKRLGLKKWRLACKSLIIACMRAFLADYAMIGGGNAKYLQDLPAGARRGHNQTAFRGGYRIWGVEGIPTQGDNTEQKPDEWNMM
jgi:Transcriptional regulator/sugar kinase